jgi:hypothetical protein
MAGWPHSRSGARELNSSSQNAGRSGIGLKRIPRELGAHRPRVCTGFRPVMAVSACFFRAMMWHVR